MPDNRLPYIDDLVSWLGIAWIVAFLAGLWGAMIGIGKFGIAEFLFLLCGGICLVKVVYETLRDRTPKRAVVCAACLVAVVAIELGVVRWTGDLSIEAAEQQKRLARLDQIPVLQGQVADLKNAEQIDVAKSQQQVADIGRANDDLKVSIEKKDAALASIAKQQYALNFFPQVVISTDNSPTNAKIINNGKTNITVRSLTSDGVSQMDIKTPYTIVYQAWMGIGPNEQKKADLLQHVTFSQGTNDFRVSRDYIITIGTLDGKSYLVPFTWTFIAKDGSLSSSFTVQGPITQVK